MASTGAIDQAQHAARETGSGRPHQRPRDEGNLRALFQGAGPQGARRALRRRRASPRAGLRVFTTLDPELQQAAEKTVEDGLAAIERRRGYPHPRRDAHPKGIRLPAGRARRDGSAHRRGPGDGRRPRLRARAGSIAPRRRSGRADRPSSRSSTPPRSRRAIRRRASSPTSTRRSSTPDGKWVPEDGHSSAELDDDALRAADVEQSRRGPDARTRSAFRRPSSYAQKLNVGTPPSVPSLALGASDVTLLSLTAAYGAFADEGHAAHAGARSAASRTATARCSTRMPASRSARSAKSTAFLMSSMLADVINAAPPTRRGRPASRCRRRGRRAPPTTTWTPGSSASRRTS